MISPKNQNTILKRRSQIQQNHYRRNQGKYFLNYLFGFPVGVIIQGGNLIFK